MPQGQLPVDAWSETRQMFDQSPTLHCLIIQPFIFNHCEVHMHEALRQPSISSHSLWHWTGVNNLLPVLCLTFYWQLHTDCGDEHTNIIPTLSQITDTIHLTESCTRTWIESRLQLLSLAIARSILDSTHGDPHVASHSKPTNDALDNRDNHCTFEHGMLRG
jgi:hypothetical protein